MTCEKYVGALTKLRRDIVHVVAWMVRWQQRTNESPDLETILGPGEAEDIFMSVYYFVLCSRQSAPLSSTGWMFPRDAPQPTGVDGCGQCQWKGSCDTRQIAGERPPSVSERRASAQTRVIFASAAEKFQAPRISME